MQGDPLQHRADLRESSRSPARPTLKGADGSPTATPSHPAPPRLVAGGRHVIRSCPQAKAFGPNDLSQHPEEADLEP